MFLQIKKTSAIEKKSAGISDQGGSIGQTT
jgi:hypothetical protein